MAALTRDLAACRRDRAPLLWRPRLRRLRRPPARASPRSPHPAVRHLLPRPPGRAIRRDERAVLLRARRPLAGLQAHVFRECRPRMLAVSRPRSRLSGGGQFWCRRHSRFRSRWTRRRRTTWRRRRRSHSAAARKTRTNVMALARGRASGRRVQRRVAPHAATCGHTGIRLRAARMPKRRVPAESVAPIPWSR